MLHLEGKGRKGQSDVEFEFRFPGLGKENVPAKITLASMAFSGRSVLSRVRFKCVFMPIVSITSSKEDFLKGTMRSVALETIRYLRDKCNKKHWLDPPKGTFKGATGIMGRLKSIFALSMPKDTLFFSDSKEHLQMLGFVASDIKDIEMLGVSDTDGEPLVGWYVEPNSNTSFVPTQMSTLVGVEGSPVKQGREMFPSSQNLGKAVRYGFVRPATKYVYEEGFDMRLTTGDSVTEKGKSLDAKLREMFASCNVPRLFQFGAHEDKIVLKKFAVKDDPRYGIELSFGPEVQSMLEFPFNDQLLTFENPREEIWSSHVNMDAVTLLVKVRDYPLTVHTPSMVVNSYATAYGFGSSFAQLGINNKIEATAPITFPNRDGVHKFRCFFRTRVGDVVRFAEETLIDCTFRCDL